MIENRCDLIQHLIDHYGLSRYLEIGIERAETFNKINCPFKTGVDPAALVDFPKLVKQTSDEFFASHDFEFDIVFIDGLHLCEQVIRDIVNSWNCLKMGGFIVIHDCLPHVAIETNRVQPPHPWGWTGDVYKAVIWFKHAYPSVECFVLNMDWGLGVIAKTQDMKIAVSDHSWTADYDFDWLQKNLKELNIRTEWKDQ